LGLSYGEIADLEQHLVSKGRSLLGASDEYDVTDIDEWYNAESAAPIRSVVSPESFASLCESSRTRHEPRVRALAAGALVHIRDYGSDNAELVKFVTRFAQNRIAALTGAGPLWSGMPISKAEREDAEALFEAARSDRSYTDDELFDSVAKFVGEYNQYPGLFGRLSHDLTLLTEYLANDHADPLEVETARAALSYFCAVSDAVPDDLGLVGLIDDMYVVGKAVADLCPVRGSLIGFLDGVLKQWPFLNQLTLGTRVKERCVSEYVLTNSAMLVEELGDHDTTPGTIVVVPEIGPLPLLAGFVRAASEILTNADESGVPDFKPGDKIVETASQKVVIFRGYVKRVAGTKMVLCPPSEAEFFRFTELLLKSRGSKTEHTTTIKEIYGFKRCSEDRRVTKGKELAFKRDEVQVGPLEYLAGSTSPIHPSQDTGMTIVVGQLGRMREFTETITMFGTSLSDSIPTGRAFVDDEIDFEMWSSESSGSRPTLTFVRTTSEAAQLAEDPEICVTAVVAGVRPYSTDMVNLKRIASYGVRVLAFVEERDEEVLEFVDGEEFSIWAWDEEALGSLHWVDLTDDDDGPVALLERRARNRSKRSSNIVEMNLDGLDAAAESLVRLKDMIEEDESSPLADIGGEGFLCLTRICRCMSEDLAGFRKLITDQLSSLRSTIDSNRLWLSDAAIETARTAVDNLESAFKSILEGNPKLDYVRKWAEKVESGNLVTGNGYAEGLSELIANDRVVIGMPRGHAQIEDEAVVSGWFGPDKMSRFLVPPMSESTHVLLYKPESKWYWAFLQRRNRYESRVQRLRRFHPPFPGMGVVISDEPKARPEATGGQAYPDGLITAARRQRVTRAIQSSYDETVEARVVHFAGDSWAMFTPDHVVNVLVASSRETGFVSQEDLSIRTVKARELDQSDLVLLLRGSDRDVIRSRVDELEGVRQLRKYARKWQEALRVHRAKYDLSYKKLREQLATAGCRRSVPTIRHWITDNSMIGPRHGRVDLEAILAVTGSQDLGTNLDECESAIRELKGLHLSAAIQLAREVLETASEWLDAVESPEEVIEIDDRLILVTVDSVERELISAPRGMTNKLQVEA